MADMTMGLKIYPGNYDDYRWLLSQARAQQLANNAKAKDKILRITRFRTSLFQANKSKSTTSDITCQNKLP